MLILTILVNAFVESYQTQAVIVAFEAVKYKYLARQIDK
ncbi:hypothetical protein PMAG_a0533 [Pseudoalteromonas mariniglutinosa NCIMB 1770]|nr:hypothetical protein [Pseudoalteromonas mariniglutinosa NCIMB 1770]